MGTLKIFGITLLVSVLGLVACDSFQKTIDVDLPTYESEMVVECYLRHNEPVRLLLSRSVPYFGEVTLPQVPDANVTITLRRGVFLSTWGLNFTVPTSLQPGEFFYNYQGTDRYDSTHRNGVYELRIEDRETGEVLTGKTQYIPAPKITAIEARFRESDTTAFLLTKFPDNDPNERNYYRLVVIKRLSKGAQKIVNDITFEGRFKTGNEISIGSNYDFRDRDTAEVRLYHLSREYFDFLRTVDDARQGNLNPFAQPTVVQSNVQGGLGIFTVLAYDEQVFVVKYEK
ncbi:hypothetical protein BKI52_14880 [marine bacterium AO1-C]|nr:hypothetical protein BKI52_14880 [marine bacterium AO1-C]